MNLREDASVGLHVALGDPELDLLDAIGHAIRLYRRLEGLSQRRLADNLGWDRSKVARWETGDLPPIVARIDGLLRAMGYRILVVPMREMEERLTEGEVEIMEHIRDRGERRFPAHLKVIPEHAMSTYNWCRHCGEPSPLANGMQFVRELDKDDRRLRALGEPTERPVSAPASPAQADEQPS